MATVSLADKYYGTYESQQKKADIPEFVTFMKQYGTVAYPVLSLSDSKKALVKEAIPLIKTDKWKSGDVAVSVKKYVISSGAYLTNRNKDITSNCCKIISPKGDVYACDMNMSKTLYYDRDGFFFNKRAEKNLNIRSSGALICRQNMNVISRKKSSGNRFSSRIIRKKSRHFICASMMTERPLPRQTAWYLGSVRSSAEASVRNGWKF